VSTTYDAVIVGAGPAGMAAATVMADHQAKVLVLDEQPAPGGQIYRAVEAMSVQMPELFQAMGRDYARGDEIVARFRTSGAEFRPLSTVWNAVAGMPHEVWVSSGGKSAPVFARTLVLATGAMERPVPVPGWTLPGVMGAGAVQVLLKSAGVVPEGMVFAGSGPLILLLAVQCLAAGAQLTAVLDTTPKGNVLAAARHIPAAFRGAGPSYLWKGLSLKTTLRREGVKLFRNVTNVELHGRSEVTDISFHSNGRPLWLSAGVVALHEGIIPAQQFTRMLGCAHEWNEVQRCFRPVVDMFGWSSVPGVLVAGDGAGIGGARAAEHSGRIAGAAALHNIGKLDARARDRLVAPELHQRRAQLAVRPFLDRLYAPPSWVVRPEDPVIVCRCEEVTAGAVREAARVGAQGPNQAKSFVRAGMGPCQGRICGPVVSELMAEAHGTNVGTAGYYRIRAPLKPVTVAELAGASG
jgi:NADPH-dependent 2,4-dienoyl-CoA reductase/sulfur reductase-like enzyme